MSSPVKAEAEYSPNASTTYEDRGTHVIIKANPIRAMDSKSTQTGHPAYGAHPYSATMAGMTLTPPIRNGNRSSG